VIVVMLRLGGLVALAAGVTAEVVKVVPATGLALLLGTFLASYLWFLSVVRRREGSPRRRGQ
jgi:hypothetical protein